MYICNLVFYSLTLVKKLDKSHPIICFFPNHKSEKRQVIKSSSFFLLSSFSKALNETFEQSLDATEMSGSTKFAVCYGKHIFICHGISGTIYLFWATHVNRTNVGNVANTIYNNVPILFNLDGQGHVKAVFILKANVQDESDLDRLPITHDNPKLYFNKEIPLFVCEVKVRNPYEGYTDIHTISRKEALATVSVQTKPNQMIFKREKNAFAASMVMEESDVYCGSGPDGGTPRPDLFMRDVDPRCVDNTPPIIKSDGEVMDDPFREEIV